MEKCVILLSDMWNSLPKLVYIIERVPKKALFLTGVKKRSEVNVTDVNLPFVIIPHASRNTKVTSGQFVLA